MAKYRDMTYTIRKDGRLMKKKEYRGQAYYLYSDNERDLYNQYIELNYKLNTDQISNNKINFKAYAEKWLKFNSNGKSDATIKEYNYILSKYLIPYFGFIQIDKITRQDIQSMQADLLESNHIELAHKCIRFMKTICNEAIIDNFLIKNPCLNIKEPKLIHKEKEILTPEQDQLLLLSNHKYAPFFRILRYTGMRREEITAITKKDIDLNKRTILINKAVDFSHNQPKLKETKNKKSRVIPILDIIYGDIKNVVESSKGLLFVKQDGGMLTQEAIRCMTASFCKNVGFKFTPHQLRHSYCTMLYYSGIKIKETQNLMGHSSAKMVYDLYAHLNAQNQDVSSQINDYISGLVAVRCQSVVSKKD